MLVTHMKEKQQVGCEFADHKTWGGACAATCIEIVHCSESDSGGAAPPLHPPCTPPLLRLPIYDTIPCLKLCVMCSERFRGAAFLLNCSCATISEPFWSLQPALHSGIDLG